MKYVYSETPESMKGMGEYRYDSSLYVCGMEKIICWLSVNIKCVRSFEYERCRETT